MVELLLERGADPNTTLRGGETVLMTAARTGKAGPGEGAARARRERECEGTARTDRADVGGGGWPRRGR